MYRIGAMDLKMRKGGDENIVNVYGDNNIPVESGMILGRVDNRVLS